MQNALLRISVIVLTGALSLSAMTPAMQKRGPESPIKEKPGKKAKTEQTTEPAPTLTLTDIPADIQIKFIEHIIQSARTVQEATQNIRNLAQTNTAYRGFINASDINESILNLLATRFFADGDLLIAAKLLHTPAALAWHADHLPPDLLDNKDFKALYAPATSRIHKLSSEEKTKYVLEQFKRIRANKIFQKILDDPYVMIWLIKKITEVYFKPNTSTNQFYTASLLFNYDPKIFNNKILRRWLAQRPYSLIAAMSLKDSSLLDLLFKEGININMVDATGNTALTALLLNSPLLISCQTDNKLISLCTLLIKHGINVNYINTEDQSALTLAMNLDCPTIVQLLLNAQANIHIEGENKNTLLHIVIKNLIHLLDDTVYPNARRNLQILELLLEKGANPNKRNGDEETPLQIVETYVEIITQEEGDIAQALEIAESAAKLLRKYGAT